MCNSSELKYKMTALLEDSSNMMLDYVLDQLGGSGYHAVTMDSTQLEDAPRCVSKVVLNIRGRDYFDTVEVDLFKMMYAILAKDNVFQVGPMDIPIKMNFGAREDSRMFHEFLSSFKLKAAYDKAILSDEKNIGEEDLFYEKNECNPFLRIYAQFSWDKTNKYLGYGIKWYYIRNLWACEYARKVIENITIANEW